MSDETPFDLGKFIPGFSFLQDLSKGGAGPASMGASSLSHWIAPTVDVDELERRINELKAVQFWLEQNLLGLKATIQALEVQKMTLATLRSMNLSVAEIANALTLPTADDAEGSARPRSQHQDWPYKSKPEAEAAPSAAGDAAGASAVLPEATGADDSEASAATAAKDQDQDAAQRPGLDPILWWGALTQQFQEIAARTLKEAAHNVMPPMPTAEEPVAKGKKVPTKEAKKKARAATPARKAATKAGAGGKASKKQAKATRAAGKA